MPPRTVVSIIRELQSGATLAASLSSADRQRVVEHLMGEGLSVVDTAEMLKVCERTVHRDRAAIREANAVEPYPGFVGEIVGSIVLHADASIARLRRIARDKQASLAAKIQAELGCWQVARELVETLQSLAYLPAAPTTFQGELTHRVEVAPSYQDLHAEMERVACIVSTVAARGEDAGAGEEGEVLERVEILRDTLNRLSLQEQVAALPRPAQAAPASAPTPTPTSTIAPSTTLSANPNTEPSVGDPGHE